jgi:hypothetical protein
VHVSLRACTVIIYYNYLISCVSAMKLHINLSYKRKHSMLEITRVETIGSGQLQVGGCAPCCCNLNLNGLRATEVMLVQVDPHCPRK